MITYEQALELKEAGFPSVKEPKFDQGYWCSEDEGEGVYIPTLEELIKACGDKLKTLYRHGDVWVATPEDCTLCDWENWEGIRAEGLTPEEAVKNLYIALNKK